MQITQRSPLLVFSCSPKKSKVKAQLMYGSETFFNDKEADSFIRKMRADGYQVSSVENKEYRTVIVYYNKKERY